MKQDTTDIQFVEIAVGGNWARIANKRIDAYTTEDADKYKNILCSSFFDGSKWRSFLHVLFSAAGECYSFSHPRVKNVRPPLF